MNRTIDTAKSLYLEDLSVGQRFTSSQYRMDEDRMKAFAAEFDPQPFHLEEAAAERSVFHGLAASGWHTAAVTMRLLVTGGLPLANGIIGLGGEIVWSKPTRPGDMLHVESEILEVRPSQSRPDMGSLRSQMTTFSQEDEPVLRFIALALMRRRPAAD